jgi:phage terminase large subunit-like protein
MTVKAAVCRLLTVCVEDDVIDPPVPAFALTVCAGALIVYWPETGAVRCWCWLPGEPPLSERALEDKVPFAVWGREGYITTFPGRSTDHRAVVILLAELSGKFDIAAIAFDRWRIDHLLLLLEEQGIQLPLEPHGQGYKDFSPAVDALERLVLDHALRCNNNPVLTWAMGNVAVMTDPAGGRKFDKGRAQYRRIDPAVALAMAIGIASRMTPPEPLDFENSLLTV